MSAPAAAPQALSPGAPYLDPAPRTAALPSGPGALLERLSGGCSGRGLSGLGERLGLLGRLVAADSADCEVDLAALRGGAPAVGPVERSAAHLLSLGGKRLRPACVALAARVGEGGGAAVRNLSVAVELVHSATLLHDDVVDLGDRRRGAPAARTLYGNAASIFAGDWLLVEALRRVRRAEVPGTLDRLLAVIEEMIVAESIQLEARGRIQADRTSYFRVIEGKTAALFRWALWAGGRAGGLDDDACRALERFGRHLGVAFQAVDDLLDLTGDEAATGKALFADLREGKMTFPLIVAIEREPALGRAIEAALAEPGAELPAQPLEALRAGIARTGAAAACRSLADAEAALAIACLDPLPDGPARRALATVAEATVTRDR